jgi:hypothetical protein
MGIYGLENLFNDEDGGLINDPENSEEGDLGLTNDLDDLIAGDAGPSKLKIHFI